MYYGMCNPIEEEIRLSLIKNYARTDRLTKAQRRHVGEREAWSG